MRVRVSLASRKNLEFGELERFGDIVNPNLAISVLPGTARARGAAAPLNSLCYFSLIPTYVLYRRGVF